MKIVAGIDIGNATTETALARLEAGKLEFLASGTVPTTGIKGTRQNINGIFHSLADAWYPADALDAAVSSGSFTTGGMIILPCSMKTLSAIASGYTGELLSRAADVTIKEGRTLVLCPRETPLNAIHLENMLKLSRIGVKIVPPMPSFYQNPTTIEDLVHYQVVRVLDQLNIHIEHSGRWDKIPEAIERT